MVGDQDYWLIGMLNEVAIQILQQFSEDQNSPDAKQFGNAIIALCDKTICQFDQRRAEIGDRINLDAQIISNAMDGLASVY